MVVNLVLERGAHYLLTVKANRSTPHNQLKALSCNDIPAAHTAQQPSARRIVKVATASAASATTVHDEKSHTAVASCGSEGVGTTYQNQQPWVAR